jgi:hypothetical protein
MPHESTDYTRPSLQTTSAVEHGFLARSIRRATGGLDRYGDRVPSFIFVIAVAVVLIAAVACSRGGYAHLEIEQYIPHYLSHRPLLEKIYDYKKVEVWLSYRPRPLSYVVDDFDVAFIAWSARHGFPHLLSLSYYIFWALDCFLLWFYFCRRLGLHRLTAGLLICLFSTDSVVFAHTGYFRSAKPGGTFFLVAAFVVLAECFRAVLRRRSTLQCGILAGFGAVLLLCGCLFDEIPAAFSVSAAVMLMFEWLWNRNSPRARACLYCLIPILLVLAAFTFYDLVGHKWLIWKIDGERASMWYQTGTAAALLWHPAVLLMGTISVFVDVFGRLTGDLPTVLSLILMLALISTWWGSDASSQAQSQLGVRHFLHGEVPKPLMRILLGGFLMICCLYGMIARHHPIMRTDVRSSDYVLPLTGVFLIFLGITASLLITRRYLSKSALQLILIVLVASNLVLVVSERVFSHGDPFTDALLTALRDPAALAPRFPDDPDFPRLKSDVLTSPIYKTLHAEMMKGH